MRTHTPPSDALLKRIRTKRGWTQQQLADSLKVNLRTVGRWERGERQPPAETYRRLLRLGAS